MDDIAKIKQYEALREDHKLAFQLAGEYAKWFISTLLLLHSGAIAAIVQNGADPRFTRATIILGLGIALALLAGLAGWINLQLASKYYRRSATDLLQRKATNSWPTQARTAALVALTLIILSAIMLGIGAVLIWRQLF